MARRRAGVNSDASARKQGVAPPSPIPAARRRDGEDTEDDCSKREYPLAAEPVAERTERQGADRRAKQRGRE
jgi:hypothetical protein